MPGSSRIEIVERASGVGVTLAEVFDHIDTLDGDPWPLVKRLAASGDRSLVPPVQAALERYLDDNDWYGRDLMIYILIGLRGAAAFPLLLRAFARLLRGDERDNICAWLADLVKTDPVACRPTIRSFVASGHRGLRRAGLWALGYAVTPGDLVLLREALTDPDPQVRQAALGCLPSLKADPRAYALAIGALTDPDPSNRRSAVLNLRWFAVPASVEHLVPLAADPAAFVRSVLGETIGALAAEPSAPLGAAPGADSGVDPGIDSGYRPAAITALRSLLADPDPYTRAGAVRGLGLLGGPIDDLQTAAGDPDPAVRAVVAAALGANAGPHLAETLHALARDESATVRADLVTALGHCGWPGASSLIIALASDPDRMVRTRAEAALTRLR